MRLVMTLATLASFALATQAEAAPPAKAPPKQAAAPAAPPPPPPGMFPCRTESEICFIAIVGGKNQVMVQYTNAQGAEGIDQKPTNVFSDDGTTALDMSQNIGRVVMLTGTYDAKGLTKAAVVDVASPLLSFAIKSQMSGGDDQGSAQQAPPKKR